MFGFPSGWVGAERDPAGAGKPLHAAAVCVRQGQVDAEGEFLGF